MRKSALSLFFFTMVISVTAPALDYAVDGPLSGSYSGWNRRTNQCDVSTSMNVYLPQASGSFPVFLYTVGTGALVSSAEGELAAREMAKRGFVAAVLQYDSGAGFSCLSMQRKAECTYSQNASASAPALLCGLAQADCSKGIVVGGLSQGANMAILAANYDSRVRAAWLMGFGGGASGNSYTECFIDSKTALPSDRLRVVNGREGQGQPIANLNNSTGTFCWPSRQSCFRANGSGWYLVDNGQVEDGHADHCYFAGPASDGSEIGCSRNVVRGDVGWVPPATAPWSLNAGLNWLASFR